MVRVDTLLCFLLNAMYNLSYSHTTCQPKIKKILQLFSSSTAGFRSDEKQSGFTRHILRGGGLCSASAPGDKGKLRSAGDGLKAETDGEQLAALKQSQPPASTSPPRKLQVFLIPLRSQPSTVSLPRRKYFEMGAVFWSLQRGS